MNPVLSTQLGTRHRAGIGITEETDAIAVIVSEETGAISVAIGGKIERDMMPDALRIRLGELLRRHVRQTTLPTPINQEDTQGAGHSMDFLRRLFLENFGLKVFAILLAFTLWMMVHRDPITEVAVEVPVEFHNIPLNVEIRFRYGVPQHGAIARP